MRWCVFGVLALWSVGAASETRFIKDIAAQSVMAFAMSSEDYSQYQEHGAYLIKQEEFAEYEAISPSSHIAVSNQLAWSRQNIIVFLDADSTSNKVDKAARAAFQQVEPSLLNSVMAGYQNALNIRVIPNRHKGDKGRVIAKQHLDRDFTQPWQGTVFYSGYSVPGHYTNTLLLSTDSEEHHFLGLALKLEHVSEPVNVHQLNLQLQEPLGYEEAIVVRFSAYHLGNLDYSFTMGDEQLPTGAFLYQYPTVLGDDQWVSSPTLLSNHQRYYLKP